MRYCWDPLLFYSSHAQLFPTRTMVFGWLTAYPSNNINRYIDSDTIIISNKFWIYNNAKVLALRFALHNTITFVIASYIKAMILLQKIYNNKNCDVGRKIPSSVYCIICPFIIHYEINHHKHKYENTLMKHLTKLLFWFKRIVYLE